MSDSRKSTSGDNGGDAFGLGAAWAAPFEAMQAWSKTWASVMDQRGAPALEMMMGALANPAKWPESVAPLMEEIERAFALPRFADLPRFDASALPSAGTALDMMLLFQQYLIAAAPVWMKACDRFQAEVRERREKGEVLDVVADGMDIWNNVLDRTLMEFNRSADYGDLQQKMLRMAMKQRQDIRRRVEIASEAMDMPTRTEMLDVYQRLHGLMREVSSLRREVRELKRAKPAAGRSAPSEDKTEAAPAARSAPRAVQTRSRRQA